MEENIGGEVIISQEELDMQAVAEEKATYSESEEVDNNE